MGFAAITTNSGELMIFDPAGKSTVGFNFDPTDPPLLIEAPEGSPAGVVWMSLARRSNGSAATVNLARSSGIVRSHGKVGH